MSPEDEAQFGAKFETAIFGRLQIDQLLRASAALYLKPREIQAGNNNSVYVSTDYDHTEYSSLDMLRSPLRSNTLDKWTPKEIALFESCICAYGKDFHCMSRHIGSKTTNECVEFYYTVWKHSHHYYIWDAHRRECEAAPPQPPADTAAPTWASLAALTTAGPSGSPEFVRRLALVRPLSGVALADAPPAPAQTEAPKPAAPADAAEGEAEESAPVRVSSRLAALATPMQEYSRVVAAAALTAHGGMHLVATHATKDANGSSSLCAYPASNPYHLSSARNRGEEERRGKQQPYTPGVGTGGEAAAVPGWVEPTPVAASTIKVVSGQIDKQSERQRDRRRPALVCETCSQEFPNAQQLFVHVRDEHYTQ
jgi:hypothetical protein